MSKKKKPTLEDVIEYAAYCDRSAKLRDDPEEKKMYENLKMIVEDIAVHFFRMDKVDVTDLVFDSEWKYLEESYKKFKEEYPWVSMEFTDYIADKI